MLALLRKYLQLQATPFAPVRKNNVWYEKNGLQ